MSKEMNESEQLRIFDDAVVLKKVKKTNKGGSANPIVFNDYESFVRKFTDVPKTTDDCYTPQDVYEAVVRYVGTLVDMEGKCILRPFYPGGDYENAEYPDNGIVIDNPPFSILTKIVRFYMANEVPFFLFGAGMTIMRYCKYGATAIIPGGNGIKFHNGALVRINYTTNLVPDIMAMTAPMLKDMIENCPSQNEKAMLPKYAYPDNVVSVSRLQTIAQGGIEMKIPRKACAIIGGLDLHPKGTGTLFGDHLLVDEAHARAQAEAHARVQAEAHARAQAEAARAIYIELSEREKRIIERLNSESKTALRERQNTGVKSQS